MKIAIKKFIGKKVLGLKITTNMHEASRECPQVFQALFEQLAEQNQHHVTAKEMIEDGCGSYGVSLLVDKEQGIFDYFAAVPFQEDSPFLLEKGEIIDIPSAEYAVCESHDLSELKSIYALIYGDWIASHPDYQLNYQSYCFEYYYPDFQQTGRYAIYCPLNKAV